MTLTQLEYVIAVDTYKSFGEAAKHCFVTQPTLSMQIKKIEEELNIRIFDRSKKPVLTTDIGRQIIDQARIALQEAGRIKEIIQDQKDEIKGEIRIGIIPTLSPYLLPLFITEFIKKYPDVQLVIEELMSEEIVSRLYNDLLDVGILVTPIDQQSIVEMPLFYEKFVAYMSTGHPLSSKDKINIADLDVNDMWLLKEGHCFRNQSINICGDAYQQSRNHLKFESGSLETLCRIVEKQFGYTLMPELATFDLEASKNKYVKQFSHPEPIREVSLVIHRSYMKKRLINLLKTEILLHIPENLKDKNRGRLVDWVEKT